MSQLARNIALGTAIPLAGVVTLLSCGGGGEEHVESAPVSIAVRFVVDPEGAVAGALGRWRQLADDVVCQRTFHAKAAARRAFAARCIPVVSIGCHRTLTSPAQG